MSVRLTTKSHLLQVCSVDCFPDLVNAQLRSLRLLQRDQLRRHQCQEKEKPWVKTNSVGVLQKSRERFCYSENPSFKCGRGSQREIATVIIGSESEKWSKMPVSSWIFYSHVDRTVTPAQYLPCASLPPKGVPARTNLKNLPNACS